MAAESSRRAPLLTAEDREPKPLRDDELRPARAFIRDVLELARQEDAADRHARGGSGGSAGPFPGVIQAPDGRLWVGNGCRGTKGVGHAPAPDRADASPYVDPLLRARYDALTGDAARAADAVRLDGQGDQLRPVIVTPRRDPLELTLAQRLAVALVEPEELARWVARVLARDSKPFLARAEAVGGEFLRAGYRAWEVGR